MVHCDHLWGPLDDEGADDDHERRCYTCDLLYDEWTDGMEVVIRTSRSEPPLTIPVPRRSEDDAPVKEIVVTVRFVYGESAA